MSGRWQDEQNSRNTIQTSSTWLYSLHGPQRITHQVQTEVGIIVDLDKYSLYAESEPCKMNRNADPDLLELEVDPDVTAPKPREQA
jgi:hypothetical protein